MIKYDDLTNQLVYDGYKLVWKVSKSGIKKDKVETRSKYVRIHINGVEYKEHRLIWFIVYKKWPSGVIDHINGNKKDNRICNLRDVTHKINSQNRKILTGVTFHKPSSKWIIRLIIDGKMKHLGQFSDKNEADNKCLELRRIYYEGNTL